MATRPDPELLNRTHEPEIQSVLDSLADSIEEIVSFGTHIFDWYSKSVAGGTDPVVPIAMFLRHFIETLDGISVLVRQSSIEPAKILARSAFEATLYIEWILQDDSERRSMAFMAWHYNQKLKLLRRLDKSTQEGKAIRKRLKGTAFGDFDFWDTKDPFREKTALEKLLASPRFLEAANEYDRIREKVKNPAWYYLFDGAQNIEQLAIKLKGDWQGWYEFLYRYWSGVTHGTEVITGKIKSSDGVTRIARLRVPEGIEVFYVLSSSLALNIYRKLTKKYIPAKKEVTAEWYEKEIKKTFLYYSKTKIFTTDF